MNIIAVYPGRFQPFHKGHGQVYKWLKKKFGHVKIATSNKTEPPKSPFNFIEKKRMMELAGVAPGDIIEVRNPYIASEILAAYDGSKTVLVFAVSEKDMQEDPRFRFSPTKAGTPSYLQPFPSDAKDLKPFGDPKKPIGYVITTPTFKFSVLGEPMTSASELRKQFIAADETKQKAIVKDLFGKYDKGIQELMDKKIKEAAGVHAPIGLQALKKKLHEEIDHDSFGPMLDSFVSFASKKLGLKSSPQLELSKQDLGKSFGGYNPSNKSIVIATKNRHPMDIFRTVAHELVHHKQNEEGRITNAAEEGSTGSPIENEANAEAGKIMRWFAKSNPEMFKAGYVTEEAENLTEGLNDSAKFKAVFLAGGPGSGKDYVMKQTITGHGMQEVNSDVALEFLMRKAGLDFKMPPNERHERDLVRGQAKHMTKERQRLTLAGRRGIIINGTADDPEKIAMIKKELEAYGYDTMMVSVLTSDQVSKERNIQRGQDGGREVPEDIRAEKWKASRDAQPAMKRLFGADKFVQIDNSADLRKADPETVKRVTGEFQKVFKMVKSFAHGPVENKAAKEWMKKEAERRGISDVKPARATTINTKPHTPAPAVSNMHPSSITMPQSSSDSSPPPVKPQEKMKISATSISRAPGVAVKPTDVAPNAAEMEQAKRLGLTYMKFGRWGKTVKGQNVVTHISKNGQLQMKKNPMVAESAMDKKFKRKFDRKDTYKREWGTPSLTDIYKRDTPGQFTEDGDGIGPTYDVRKTPSVISFTGISENISQWANRLDVQNRYVEKYGDLADQKLLESAMELNRIYEDKTVSILSKVVKR